MKTIQFTGTEYEINNLEVALAKNDLDLKTETKVCVISADLFDEIYHSVIFDDDFYNMAVLEGFVYTLAEFQEAFNLEDISSATDIIRFINVKI